jgi:integrase
MLALRWDPMGGKEIRFTEQTKSDEAACPFPITKALKRVLADQRKLTSHLKSPHVFVFAVGKKMAGRPISYMGYLHDARDAADTRRDLLPHDCRRTAIDRMERLGLARSTAMKSNAHRSNGRHGKPLMQTRVSRS